MESLEESLKVLKLPVLAERLDGWLETAAKQNWTPREFLERVVAEELSKKRGKRTEMGVRMARFPFVILFCIQDVANVCSRQGGALWRELQPFPKTKSFGPTSFGTTPKPLRRCSEHSLFS